MSAASTTPGVHVTLEARQLNVARWSTSDLTVLAAARAAVERDEDLGAWLARVVGIGAAAVSTAGHSSDLTRIDSAMDRLDRQIQTSLEAATTRLGESVQRATDPETGDVTRAAQAAVDRLAAGVQRVLTGPGALLPDATTRAVSQVTNTALAEIHRILDQDRKALAQLVAQDRDRTAIELVAAVSTHQSDLTGIVTELKDLLAARSITEAHQASGPRKGLAYEAAVHTALSDIAGNAGDGGADFTGGTGGVDGSRKGDVVVELRSLPRSPRLVAEAKDRPARHLSVREWSVELEAAMRARQAHVAIGICPPEQMPGGLPVLVLDQRRLLVSWSPDDGDNVLTAAYLLMRMAAGQNHDGSSPSRDQLEGHLRSMAAAIAGLDEIQRHAASCRRTAEKIATAASKATAELSQRIELTAGAAQDQVA
jgi:hypothetical protein